MVDTAPNHPRSTTGSLIRKAYAMVKDGTLQRIDLSEDDIQKMLRQVNEASGPIKEEEYEEIFRQDCDCIGTEKALSKKKLTDLLDELAEYHASFKAHIADKSTLALGILPTTAMGTNLSDEEIENGRHIRPMIVKENGATEASISLVKGPYFYVLPKKQQEKCSIQIKYSHNDSDDFARIHNFCIDAFNAWREFFGLEPIEDIPRLELSD